MDLYFTVARDNLVPAVGGASVVESGLLLTIVGSAGWGGGVAK